MEQQFSPITLDAPLDWLGQFPEAEFDRQNKARAAKMERAARVLKVRQGKPQDEAGHDDVEDAYRWQERLLPRLLPTWAGLVRGLLLPPRTRWLELRSDDPEMKIMADAVSELFWSLLMENGRHFPDELENIILESGAGFGLVGRVSFESCVDPVTGQAKETPALDLYDFDDFVLDAAARDWRESFLVVRHRYSRRQLLSLSRPLHDEAGNLVRGAVFDAQAVEEAMSRVMQETASASALGEVKNSVRCQEPCETEWFTAYEFLGSAPHPELELPDNQLITSLNGVCLRATDNPYPFRTWVLFGSRRGAAADIYPESIGEELADIEIRINRAKTATSFARYVKASGVLTFDPARGEEVRKFSRHLGIRPGALIPNVGLSMLPYNPDLRDVENERLQLLQVAEELIGVSRAALAGLPAPGVTATASQGAQQGAATRNNNDALHYTGPTVELLSIMLQVLLADMEQEKIVRLENGAPVRLTPDLLRRMKLEVRLSSIGSSSIAPYQQQMVLGAYNALFNNPWFDQREGARMVVEAFQLPEMRAAKLVKPLPPQQPIA